MSSGLGRVAVGLMMVLVMAGAGPKGAGTQAGSIRALLESKMDGLSNPVMEEREGLLAVREAFTAEEMQRLHEHISEVEKYVNERLRDGSVAGAWIAGYFRIESSLPLLRKNLLKERYFYGWEGPDPNKESSWLLDMQYPTHLAYIAGIEAISCQPVREAVKLTPKELAALKAEAKVNFAKRDDEPKKVQRGMCAKWLLRKLGPEKGGE